MKKKTFDRVDSKIDDKKASRQVTTSTSKLTRRKDRSNDKIDRKEQDELRKEFHGSEMRLKEDREASLLTGYPNSIEDH